jgi:hypothetical protein
MRTTSAIPRPCAAPGKPSARRSRTAESWLMFFLKTLAKQKDNLAAKQRCWP